MAAETGMSVELIPLKFMFGKETGKFFRFVLEAAGDPKTKEKLAKRHLPGVIKRYGGEPAEAFVNLRRAQRAPKDELTAFAIRSGVEYVGVASVQPGLPLYRQRVPLSPKLTRGNILSKRLLPPGPNVAAWAVDTGVLDPAYRHLAAITSDTGSWTIEPERSGDQVHEAISRWFEDSGHARYDDLEVSAGKLPRSVLYIQHPEE